MQLTASKTKRDRLLGWCGIAVAAIAIVGAAGISAVAGAVVGVAVGGVLLGQIVRLRGQVRALETRDPLTGIANRAAFFERLEIEVHRCRDAGKPLSIGVLDCDFFKQVNDSFGHQMGDAVLCESADALRQAAGSRGLVARLWGDAFGLLVPEVAFDEFRALLEECQRGLQERMSQHDWPVTFSIGGATFENPRACAQELLSAADAMMYSVKREGRNRLACQHLGDRGPIAKSASVPATAADAVAGEMASIGA